MFAKINLPQRTHWFPQKQTSNAEIQLYYALTGRHIFFHYLLTVLHFNYIYLQKNRQMASKYFMQHYSYQLVTFS